MSTPSPAVIAPGADADMVKVKLTDGETLSVKYDHLILSPVIRDALHMQSLADKNPGERGAILGKIEINCDLGIAKYLFGILEGKPLHALCNTFLDPTRGIADFLESEDATKPSPTVLRRILQTADFYNFPFFPRLLALHLYELAELRGAYALSAATVAVLDLKDGRLATMAVKHFKGLPGPIKFSRNVVKAIGAEVWWPLVAAYSEVLEEEEYETEDKAVSGATRFVTSVWDDLLDPWIRISEQVDFIYA